MLIAEGWWWWRGGRARGIKKELGKKIDFRTPSKMIWDIKILWDGLRLVPGLPTVQFLIVLQYAKKNHNIVVDSF